MTLTAAAGVAAASPVLARQSGFRSRRIAVTARGRGRDVVLIPGLASTPDIWQRTVDRFADRFRLHLVSIRGFGALAPEANATGALSTPVAAEIVRYIRDEGLTRPALVGHSMGGQLALRVAADRSAGVGRVMTVDASPFFPALIRPDATLAEVEPIAQLAFQAVLFLGDEALRARSRSLGLEVGGAAEAVFDTLGWQGGDRQVLAQGLYEVMTVDLRPRLPDLRAQVTVVYGSSREERSPRRDLGARLRGAYASLQATPRFEAIEGAEHMVMIDQPDRFGAAMARFLG